MTTAKHNHSYEATHSKPVLAVNHGQPSCINENHLELEPLASTPESVAPRLSRDGTRRNNS